MPAIWDVVKWIVPLAIPLILVPAVKYWLGRGYVEKSNFESYKKTCAEEAVQGAAIIREEIKGLRDLIQSWKAQHDLDKAKSDGRIDNNSNRLVELETKMKLLWNGIEESMSKLLHRDDTPDIDRLLEKLPRPGLTETEFNELIEGLEEIAEDRSADQGRRAGAGMLRASLISKYGSKYGKDSS